MLSTPNSCSFKDLAPKFLNGSSESAKPFSISMFLIWNILSFLAAVVLYVLKNLLNELSNTELTSPDINLDDNPRIPFPV